MRELLPTRTSVFTYEREITINRPVHEVFAYIRSLNNFKNWNPFLRKDPDAKIQMSGKDGEIGYVTSWEGNREMGSGEQEITRIIDGQKVEFELRFLKPFKATNQGFFATESAGGSQTRVRWSMSGRSGFPMNLISLFINCDKMIGGEFETGLPQLKSNFGEVSSQVILRHSECSESPHGKIENSFDLVARLGMLLTGSR